MKIIKGNQVIVVAIAIMLITVGYLNYSTDYGEDDRIVAVSANETNEVGLGDAKLVNADTVKDNATYTEGLVENELEGKNENMIEETNANTQDNKEELENDYYTNSRIEREAMYSQMLETYNKILESSSVSNEQKAIASKEITKITDIKNSIMIAENLIKTKGFKDVVIFANSDSINVVVKAEKLNTEDISKLQNIISREMNAEIENIHISNK